MADNKNKVCSMCGGTGFDRPGHVCPCISKGGKDDTVDYILSLFGDGLRMGGGKQ